MSFTNYTLFSKNKAFIGGAIYSFVGATLTFHGFIRFEHNTAKTNGGAICGLGSNITFWTPYGNVAMNRIIFKNNSAENGGAIYLSSASFLTLSSPVKLSTSHNRASKYGGVIYYEDVPTPIQCNYQQHRDETDINKLPYCFMNVAADDFPILYTLQSHNDSSKKDGSFIYGGLLDRCQLIHQTFRTRRVAYTWVEESFRVDKKRAITSQPYQLCFCEDDQYSCSGTKSITTQRGQRFTVSLIALDQVRTSTTTRITANTRETARLKLNEGIQTLLENCSNISYAIYSTESTKELTLYPNGPCHDTGLARAVINVTLLPCPNGFIQFNEECICEERLSEYGAVCVIDEGIHIVRGAGSKFWMNDCFMNIGAA